MRRDDFDCYLLRGAYMVLPPLIKMRYNDDRHCFSADYALQQTPLQRALIAAMPLRWSLGHSMNILLRFFAVTYAVMVFKMILVVSRRLIFSTRSACNYIVKRIIKPPAACFDFQRLSRRKFCFIKIFDAITIIDA